MARPTRLHSVAPPLNECRSALGEGPSLNRAHFLDSFTARRCTSRALQHDGCCSDDSDRDLHWLDHFPTFRSRILNASGPTLARPCRNNQKGWRGRWLILHLTFRSLSEAQRLYILRPAGHSCTLGAWYLKVSSARPPY